MTIYSGVSIQRSKYRDFSASRSATRAWFGWRMSTKRAAAESNANLEVQIAAPISSALGIDELGRKMQGGDEPAGGLQPLIASPETTAANPATEAGHLRQAKTHVAARWFVLQGSVVRPGESAQARDNGGEVERLRAGGCSLLNGW